MARADYAIVRLLHEAGEAVGFSALKTGQDDGYDYTLEHIHLAPHTKGRGLGRCLMADTARQVKAAGGTSLCLWVFDANEVAVRFYTGWVGWPMHMAPTSLRAVMPRTPASPGAISKG
jgi:L-amino acid N-acyltransferase YncA